MHWVCPPQPYLLFYQCVSAARCIESELPGLTVVRNLGSKHVCEVPAADSSFELHSRPPPVLMTLTTTANACRCTPEIHTLVPTNLRAAPGAPQLCLAPCTHIAFALPSLQPPRAILQWFSCCCHQEQTQMQQAPATEAPCSSQQQLGMKRWCSCC